MSNTIGKAAALAANMVKKNMPEGGQKITYEHEKKTIIAAKQQHTLSGDRGAKTDINLSMFCSGKVVFVVNGVTYECEEQVGVFDHGYTIFYGNGVGTVEDAINTGLPFIAILDNHDRILTFYPVDPATGILNGSDGDVVTVEVYYSKKSQKISPEYFPEGGIGYTGRKKDVLVPIQDMVAEGFMVTDTEGIYGGNITPLDVPPDSVILSIDGVEYERKLVDVVDGAAAYTNNGISDSGEMIDNGDFINLSLYTEFGVWFLLLLDPNTGEQEKVGTAHSIGIFTLGDEVHHTIKEEYIPMDAIAEKLAESGQIGKSKKLLIPFSSEQEVTFADVVNGRRYADVQWDVFPEDLAESEELNALFESGEIFQRMIITFDGVEYKCTPQFVGGELPYYGNLSIVGFGAEFDTGEPFSVRFGNGSFGVSIPDTGSTFTHTFGMRFERETITTIDPKYLPSGGGGGLTVVTLSTVVPFGEEGAELTIEEGNLFMEAYAKNLPVVCQFKALSSSGSTINNSVILYPQDTGTAYDELGAVGFFNTFKSLKVNVGVELAVYVACTNDGGFIQFDLAASFLNSLKEI
jgi:hypothetical protein